MLKKDQMSLFEEFIELNEKNEKLEMDLQEMTKKRDRVFKDFVDCFRMLSKATT